MSLLLVLVRDHTPLIDREANLDREVIEQWRIYGDMFTSYTDLAPGVFNHTGFSEAPPGRIKNIFFFALETWEQCN